MSMPQVEKRGLLSMGVNRSTNSEQGKISSWALSVAQPASEMSKCNDLVRYLTEDFQEYTYQH